MTAVPEQVQGFQRDVKRLRDEVAKVIVGHEPIVEGVIMALLSGGHALLEGVPGLGKTMLVRTLADAVDLTFSRVQFTPDLMPADILGTNVIVDDAQGKRFQFQKGPIFANVVLADEVNRATPKTQSALLEAMQEQSVTVAKTTYKLDPPFFVLATQNPLEMEGTYPLPEAQLDRFFVKLRVTFPSRDALHTILDRTTGAHDVRAGKVVDGARLLELRELARQVPVAREVQDFAIRVLEATHPPTGPDDKRPRPGLVKKFVRYGASPRGAQACLLGAKIRAVLDGRFAVSCDDVRAIAKPTLRHRLILNFEGEAEGVDPDTILDAILKETPEQIYLMALEFDESFLKKLEYLYVVSRKVFTGAMRAERRTRKVGSGVEFADHRNYAMGDDLRYLDWSVYARLDKLLLRLFEEEEDLHIYLLVDTSASMASNEKQDYALTVAAALAYVGLAKLDRVSIVPFGGGDRDRLPPSRGKGNIFKVFQFLQGLQARGQTELSRALETFVHSTKRRGIVVVISDFYDPAGYEEGLNLLRYHRFEPTVLQVWSKREADPGLRGDVEIVDVETGEKREVTVTERQLAEYKQLHAQYCDQLRDFCGARGVAYFRADTAVPFDELVLRIFRAGGFLS